jgi:hypothetical protein
MVAPFQERRDYFLLLKKGKEIATRFFALIGPDLMLCHVGSVVWLTARMTIVLSRLGSCLLDIPEA